MVTADVAMPNVADVIPCATVTAAGTVTALLALDNRTDAPPAGADADSETVPVAPPPDKTIPCYSTLDYPPGNCCKKRSGPFQGACIPGDVCL